MEKLFSKVDKLMGNTFRIAVVAKYEDLANQCIGQAVREIKRIEQLLSTYLTSSSTARINAHAGIGPVEVEQEVIDLVERSLRISEITQGAFDISYGSIDKSFWNFDVTMTSLPGPEKAREMVRLINYQNIILDRKKQTVFLKKKGMRIGFGGIGKGYAADCAKGVLVNAGIKHGVVNAAGDLTVWGTQPNGDPWTIGIADPDLQNRALASVELTNSSVATSGNYEKFVLIDGKKYSHTINPKTGYPVHGIKSVTIICPVAELADAMATPVMVMGIEAGLDLINQLKNMACIIIDEGNRIYTSKNISLTV